MFRTPSYLLLITFCIVAISLPQCKNPKTVREHPDLSLESVSSHIKTQYSSQNVELRSVDSIPAVQRNGNSGYILSSEIAGQDFQLELGQGQEFTIKQPNREYPLRVQELYPGIVSYDKYDSIEVFSHDNKEKLWLYNRVCDKLEFYVNGELRKKIFVDDTNPYLTAPKRINVMNHYSDAEHTDVLLSKDKNKTYPTTEYHLHQDIKQHGAFTSINFWKNELSDHWITGSKTTLMILDSTGQEIFNQEFDGHLSTPALSIDSRYLMVSYLDVETTNSAGINLTQNKFELWDTVLGKRVSVVTNPDKEQWVAEPKFDNGFLTCKFSHPNDKDISQTLYLFKPSSEYLYSRTFTSTEWTEISLNWFSKYKGYAKLIQSYNWDKIKINEEPK